MYNGAGVHSTATGLGLATNQRRRQPPQVSCLKACTAMDATPGSPQCCGRPLSQGATAMPAAAHPDSPAATKWASFSYLLVSSPLQQEQPRIRPGTIFLLPWWEGFCTPGAGSSFATSTKAVSAAPAETTYVDRPLTSSALLPGPVLGGALWRLPTPLVRG